MGMKAPITFGIGLFVAVLGLVQFALDQSPFRLFTAAVGGFFLVLGWFIGWTRHRGFTIALGHLAVTIGCLVIAYGLYQLPFLVQAPTLTDVLDLPLFWGLFTLMGGFCMIQHGSCACCIRNHEARNRNRTSSP